METDAKKKEKQEKKYGAVGTQHEDHARTHVHLRKWWFCFLNSRLSSASCLARTYVRIAAELAIRTYRKETRIKKKFN